MEYCGVRNINTMFEYYRQTFYVKKYYIQEILPELKLQTINSQQRLKWE